MSLKHLILAAVVALSATTSYADTFNYSYTFSFGTVLSGSFDGTAQNNLVTNLSNITASINGTPIEGSGNLYNWHHDPTNVHSTLVIGGAVASFDGTQNNFLFMNSDNVYEVFCCVTNNLLPYVDINSTNDRTWFEYRVSGELYTKYESIDNQSLSAWSLSQVSAVPEPATLALLGLSLAGVVATRRRKRA